MTPQGWGPEPSPPTRDRRVGQRLLVALVGFSLLGLLVVGCSGSALSTDSAPASTQSSSIDDASSASSPGTATGRSVASSSTVPGPPPTSTPGTAPPRVASSTTPSSAVNETGWQDVGTSVRGRPLRMMRIGTGPRHVLWIGGIHGNEPEGMTATARLPEAFTQAGLGSQVTLTILEDANPDGRAAGTRGNANGVDINRNFPAQNFDAKNPEYGGTPLSQPEAKVVDALLTSEKPDLVIVMHSWANKQFINYDGPAKAIAERFSKATGMPVEASDAIAVTPGSLGSYFGVMLGKPILTVEFTRGLDKSKAWTMIQGAALDAIRG